MDKKQKMEGARAFSRGVARHACPHEAGTIEFQDWMDGWAQQKSADEAAAQLFATQMQFSRAS
ncbi:MULTISPECIES: Rmf/CrpP family protein [unclassified Aureimonas]|uniref:Rmf/CrpP family protein n=1 Tax=unclassified Aureimonas TaxID=2615206 RepID=UPI0006F718DD|nr:MULTISPECIES: Rmf/CrpP family protein [unclassified Aureimonas]KQT69034.1 hypothetical protein ASG54_05110 [Aureimonas sp. Leaf460]KQT69269.1 hypothetical protein ASG62_17720 [Aureimonas sp. Leaf427]